MIKDDFVFLLSKSGLDRLQLSRTLGVSVKTTYNWSSNDCPEYVLAYLRLFIENKECRELRRQVESFLGLER